MGKWSDTVDCCEVHGTRRETFTREGMEASVTVRVPWTNRVALLHDLPNNRYPDEHDMRVVGIDVTPEPGTYTTNEQEIVPEFALFALKYNNKLEDDDTLGDAVSESLEKSVEFMTLDYRRFRWNERTGKLLLEKEAPGRQVWSVNLVRTHFNVPSPLSDAILDLAGCVNNASYTSALLGKTFTAETLLYVGPKLDRTLKTDGTGNWTVGLTYSYKPQGWNVFWHADTGTWDEIFSLEQDAVYKNYPPVNMGGLLA